MNTRTAGRVVSTRREAEMTTLTDLAAPARPASRARHSNAVAPDREHGRSPGRGFWIVGYVFAVTMAFSTIPTPLYVLYQARDHFGALLVTVIFAAYAVGVMASLFLAGHVSDWLGRRRMIATALAVNMLSGIVFLAWPAMPGLIAGRVISGISIGMLTATATVYLSELNAAARPAEPGRRTRDRRAPAAEAALPSAAGYDSGCGPPGVPRSGVRHGSRLRGARAVHVPRSWLHRGNAGRPLTRARGPGGF